MGFSVSGSAALIFVAMFIGFGMFYSATANGFENVNDAREDQSERLLDQQNTEINITAATYASEELIVEINNTGATELSVSKTDLLTGNEYQSGYNTSVDTDDSTDIWSPQETLTITVTLTEEPTTVKVVTETGVADTMVVS